MPITKNTVDDDSEESIKVTCSERENKIRRIVYIGLGALMLASVGYGVLHNNKEPQPDFLLSGEINGGKVVLKGAVNLTCNENGVKPAVVNAEIRLITDRSGPDSPRGRIVVTHESPGADDCVTALAEVEQHSSLITEDLTAIVGGDGTKVLAKKFDRVYKEAQKDGIQEFLFGSGATAL